MVAWWNTSWKKRKRITAPANSWGALGNFPIRIHLINKGAELSKAGMRFGIGSANENMVEANWWKFENNATDDGRNEADITLVADASYSTTHAVGDRSLSLDGTGDCATTAAVTDLKSDAKGSISGWVRFNSVASDQVIFSLGDTDADSVVRLYLDSSEGDLVFESRLTGASKTITTSGQVFAINTWYHVAVVVDADNVGRIFVDKVYVGYSADARWFSYAGAGLDNARLGCDKYNSSGNANFLNGFIDDLRIFDKVITHPDVETLNNSGSGTLTTLPRIDFSDFKAAGADIRFTDDAGNLLKHEIEIWGAPEPNVTTGTAMDGTTAVAGSGASGFCIPGGYDLVDDNVNFETNGVLAGMLIHNTTRDCLSIVGSVTNSTTLRISHPTGAASATIDWQSGDEYEIIPQAIIWVKLAALNQSVDTHVYMYYNNPAASDGQDAANVWASSIFNCVCHNSPTAFLSDSSSYDNDFIPGWVEANSVDVRYGTMTNGSCAWYIPGTYLINYRRGLDLFMDASDNQDWGVWIHANLLGANFSRNYNLVTLRRDTAQTFEVTTAQRQRYSNIQQTSSITNTSVTVQADTEYTYSYTWITAENDKVYIGMNGGRHANSLQSMNPTDWAGPGGAGDMVGRNTFNGGDTDRGLGHYSEFRVYRMALHDGYIQPTHSTLTDEMWLKYGGEEPTLYLDSISDNGPKYAGEAITFTANYSYDYGPIDLRVCKTDACPAGTCTSGWASTDSDAASPATANYTTVSDDHGANDYYVFLFDASDSDVAAVNNSQSGSFTVTAPEIDSISDDAPVYGGNDVTFTVGWTWANGNVDIRVCKTSGLTAGVCDGGEWASDTNVAGSTTDVAYTALSGDVGSNDYYVYVMDTTDTSIVAHNAPESGSFTVNGPEVTSVTESPDPALVGDQITFIVDWLWPVGNVDIYVCKSDSCTGAGCVGGANQTWTSATDVSSDPKNLKYSTTSPGTKDYYVYVYDHDDTAYGTTSGTHGTFDVNTDNIYFHFEPFRRRYGLTSYTSRWDCSEATGTTLYDRNNTTNNDLTISDATWSSSGRFYYALSFDGTDDFAYSTTVSGYANDTIGAISLWFNTTTLDSDRVLFSICDWSSTDKTYVELRHESTGELSATLIVDGTTYWSITTTGTYDIDTWYSVILSQTGVGPVIYINGSVATTLFTDTTFKNAWLKDVITDAASYKADRLILGGLGASSTVVDDHYGLIEDVRVYSEAVSVINAEDICSMASFTTGTNCSITSRDKDENQIYNKIQVLGNNAISSDVVEDAQSQQDYGERELTYTDRSIESTSDANEVANRILERYKDPIERVTLAVQSRDMREVVGDIVELTDTNTGLSGDVYRIVAIERKYGSGGDVLVYEIETL